MIDQTQPTASIIEMARGAVVERVNLEMFRVLENIQDLNTEPTKERSITITVKLRPDNNRENVKVAYEVKSKLAPAAPIETSLYAGISKGQMYAVENVPQIPGQQMLGGQEQETPKIVKLG